MLAGLSRKASLGEITGRAVDERLAASVAAALAAVARGATLLRVHDVRETRRRARRCGWRSRPPRNADADSPSNALTSTHRLQLPTTPHDHELHRQYFGTDGVRGRVGEPPITPELVLKLGWAAGRVLAADTLRAGERPGVLIGKDTRISGYLLEAALEAGLSAAGVDVYLSGPLPTPGVAYLTRALRLSAGVVISASHNPYDDNGIKFFSGAGTKLPDAVEHAIEAADGGAARLRAVRPSSARRGGCRDAPGRYIEFCKSTFPNELDLHGLAHRRRLRARRRLPRRAAGVPRTGRGGHRGAPIGLDPGVLAFTAGVALFTGLLFGIVPALRTAKLDLREALNEGSRGSTAGPGQHRLRGALVAMEIALALLLLVGSGLLLRSFSRLQEVPPGFQPDHLFVADIPLSLTAYAKPEDRYQFFDRLVERARTLPGVRSAAAASFLPVSGGGSVIHFNITGRPPKSPREFVAAGYRTITPNYLETLGVPLLQGRLFTRADNDHSPAVVVINATMVHTFFPNENPLGKRLQLGALPDQQVPTMEIVGVVGDVLPGLGTDPQAEMYLPYRQADLILPVFQLSMVMRTAGDPVLQTAALRSALAEIDPNQPLVRVRTMEENMATTVAQPRFRAWLIGIFAMLALVLSAVGVYGVMSYTVTQRTSEIGVRVTVGAQPQDVFRIIVGEALRLALVGVGVGLVAAFALTRLLRSFLYGISAYDPLTFVGVSVLLTLVAVAASFFPARRATLVDPLVALRYE